MKTTPNSSNSKRKITSSQLNRDKSTQNLSLSSHKVKKTSNKSQQITDTSAKTNNIIHPYIERISNKTNLTIQSQTQLSQHRSKSSTKTKPRNKLKESFDIRNIKACNQKDFFFSINNDCSFNQIESPESKVELLEKMIVTIKEKAINKYQEELNHKICLKETLDKSIEDYKRQINQFRSEQKMQMNANIATKKQIDVLKNVCKIALVNNISYRDLKTIIAY